MHRDEAKGVSSQDKKAQYPHQQSSGTTHARGSLRQQGVLESPTFAIASQEKELRLQAGEHRIRILHGNKGVETFTTKHPIYFCPGVKVDMNTPGGLMMSKEDFLAIRNLIHPGAFGSCYNEMNNGTDIFVWKIPADLKEIEGWVLPPKITPQSVGTYNMFDDSEYFLQPSQTAPLHGHVIAQGAAEKIVKRRDN